VKLQSEYKKVKRETVGGRKGRREEEEGDLRIRKQQKEREVVETVFQP
jgi:hypothetical protein